jgi:hypothetical protein
VDNKYLDGELEKNSRHVGALVTISANVCAGMSAQYPIII